MDEQQQIAWNCEISVAVLGNAETGEHMLIELGREGYPLSEAEVLKARLKNFVYAGVMGYAEGVANAKAEPGPDCWRIMCAATPAFLTYLSGKLKPLCDSVDWLEKLHQLPDTREN